MPAACGSTYRKMEGMSGMNRTRDHQPDSRAHLTFGPGTPSSGNGVAKPIRRRGHPDPVMWGTSRRVAEPAVRGTHQVFDAGRKAVIEALKGGSTWEDALKLGKTAAEEAGGLPKIGQLLTGQNWHVDVWPKVVAQLENGRRTFLNMQEVRAARGELGIS